jgi:gliding motility-associated-like protein
MKPKFLLATLIFVSLLSAKSFAQGGNTCAAAQANPLVFPFTHTNQTTCNFNNDYTGTNGCLAATWYGGQDYYYYFTATQTGYYTINLTNLTSGSPTQPAYAVLSLFNGCPTAGGQCISSSYLYINATNPPTAPLTASVYVCNQQSFYVVIDAYTASTSYTNCFNYTISGTFNPIPQNNSCNNMDFETGNLNGWFCTFGKSITGPTTANMPTYNIQGYTAMPNRHTIMTGGNDPCGGFPTVAPGGNFSCRIGNSSTGAEAEGISQTFLVTAANASLTYQYAVVLQDPGHQPYQQPFFSAVVKDQNCNIINCSNFTVTAGVNLPGFFTCNNTVRYKPWTTVHVDLNQYIGQYVTVDFIVGDCSAGAHYGYAYVDASCAPSFLHQNDTICVGQNSTLSAPSGYSSYNWQPGNFTTSSITVSPTTTTIYTLTIVPYSNTPNCTIQVYDTVFVMPFPNVSFTTSTPACNTPMDFTSTSSVNPGNITNWAWTFSGANPPNGTGQNATGISYPSSGTYNVTLTVTTDAGCSASATLPVNIPPCVVAVSVAGDTVCPGSCASLTAVPSSGVPPYSYTWSPNIGSGPGPIQVCPTTTTVYTCTITDSQGTTATTTATIMAYATPFACFSASPSTTTISAPTIHFSDCSSQDVTGWAWTFGDQASSTSNDQNPVFTFSDTGRYCVNLIVQNSDGCTSSTTNCVYVSPEWSLYVPNSFTPNGDGVNDFFFAYGVNIREFRIWIYDRWGNMIWTTDNMDQGWDGKANGGKKIAQEDVYVWKIRFHDVFDKKHDMVGHVSIIR